MSYASNEIRGGGSGGNAEPSMEEILASIRRILKEDEPAQTAVPEPGVTAPGAAAPGAAAPGAAAPLPPAPITLRVPEPLQPEPAAPPSTDMDDDVLLLDASMIARPADYASATAMPPVSTPAPAPLPPAGPEPLHFSSEPAPFSRDIEHIPRAMPEPVVELPPAAEPAVPLPAVSFSAPPYATAQYTAPPEPAPPPDILAEPEPAAYRPLQPPAMTPLPEPAEPPQDSPSAPYLPPSAAWLTPRPVTARTPDPMPDFAPHPTPEWQPEPAPVPEAFRTPPAYRPEPPPAPAAPAEKPKASAPYTIPAALTPNPLPTEPPMSDAPTAGFELPDSLISDKTTDAAASSIGALVRSMTTEKSVPVSRSTSITIEDIVREEIRPLLKAWLDSHLPTLVERVVRSEIERVINRSVL